VIKTQRYKNPAVNPRNSCSFGLFKPLKFIKMTVRLSRTVLGMKMLINQSKSKGNRVGFVPTMGALHEGHASLYKNARKNCDFLVGSIYANPTQFDNKKDLEKYPRTLKEDLELLERNKTDLVYLAETSDVYHNLEVKKIDYSSLTNTLEGAHRPGHFDGMTTIVRRLFEIVKPDVAFFGQKDFQQLAIIREMVRRENLQIEIVGCPIIREEEGLAMSSRNRRLSAEEYEKALQISKEVFSAAEKRADGANPNQIISEAVNRLTENGLKLDYVKIVNSNTLEVVENFDSQHEYRILIAAYSGETRLIDNGNV